jgi:hypothetical protein
MKRMVMDKEKREVLTHETSLKRVSRISLPSKQLDAVRMMSSDSSL